MAKRSTDDRRSIALRYAGAAQQTVADPLSEALAAEERAKKSFENIVNNA